MIKALTKLRNDINDGGYVQGRKRTRLRDGLKEGYSQVRALTEGDQALVAAESRGRTYLLNTPSLTA